tara:strand:+ start:902 stop:1477 length:576 start_codon:yes stop_codon:yes gene_type:complete
MRMSMANIEPGSVTLWFHVAAAYYFTFVCFFFMWELWSEYVKYRHQWLSRPCAENQSVIVDHIPMHLRSNHAIYSFFDGLFPNQVASVSIILDVKGLDTLISLRNKTAANLDYALAQHAKSNFTVRPKFVFHNWRRSLSLLLQGDSNSKSKSIKSSNNGRLKTDENDLLESNLITDPDTDTDTDTDNENSR